MSVKVSVQEPIDCSGDCPEDGDLFRHKHSRNVYQLRALPQDRWILVMLKGSRYGVGGNTPLGAFEGDRQHFYRLPPRATVTLTVE